MGRQSGSLPGQTRLGAEANDWPPLIMEYNVEAAVSGRSIGEVRQLTYNSRTSWIEEVIEADDITVRVGTFNAVGSYQKLDGHVYTEYDAITGETRTETVSDDVVRIPRGGLIPIPIAVIESALGKQAEAVATTTKVCFDDDCTELASGWRSPTETARLCSPTTPGHTGKDWQFRRDRGPGAGRPAACCQGSPRLRLNQSQGEPRIGLGRIAVVEMAGKDQES